MRDIPKSQSGSRRTGFGSQSKKEQTKDFFRTVAKSGGLFSSKYFSIKVIKKENLESEVRVVVSKKVTHSAVSRNQLKRRVRSIFKELRPCSLWVIFYAKVGSHTLSFKELENEIVYTIKKYKL